MSKSPDDGNTPPAALDGENAIPSSADEQTPALFDDSPSDTQKMIIALDAWHGWKPIIDANRGINSGQDGSLYQTLGLDLEISLINDDEESLQKLLKGEVAAIAMTVNRWAYVHARMLEAGVSGRMILFTDRSAGGDGIVTTGEISGIEGLPGHKIALSKYSVSHIMTEWLLKTSSLPPTTIEEIRGDMIFTNSAEESFEKLLAGQADVASFWEPYITQSSNTLGAKTLFTTKSANNLIIDGVIFREDYLTQHAGEIEKFIEGTLRASNEYANELQYIRQLDDYAELSDAEIFAMTDLVSFTNYADNRELFGGTVQALYTEMAGVWQTLGEKTVVNGSQTAFDDSYLLNVASKFSDDKATSLSFTDADRDKATAQINTEVLLKQTLTINFEPNVAIIQEESYPALEEFARIAKILNGAIIQVEGNIADTGVGDTESGRLLSEQRAKAVCDHLSSLGIDEARLLYKGNGITKPVAGLDPRSAEGKQANRRTDIFFITIE